MSNIPAKPEVGQVWHHWKDEKNHVTATISAVYAHNGEVSFDMGQYSCTTFPPFVSYGTGAKHTMEYIGKMRNNEEQCLKSQ